MNANPGNTHARQERAGNTSEAGGGPFPEDGDALVDGHDDARVEGRLTHVREDGSAHMVDVGDKAVTKRVARARSLVRTRPEIIDQILAGDLPKGDALAVARVAGIMAAKKTSELIPLCHPLPISSVTVDFARVDASGGDAGAAPGDALPAIEVTARVKTTGVTGVEMEALTAASIASLTIYDMIKALDRAAVVESTRVLEKSGGASGEWVNA